MIFALATRSDKDRVHMYGPVSVYLQGILLFDAGFDGRFDGCDELSQFLYIRGHIIRIECSPSVVTLASPNSILVLGM
jgi:hypothetical protein